LLALHLLIYLLLLLLLPLDLFLLSARFSCCILPDAFLLLLLALPLDLLLADLSLPIFADAFLLLSLAVTLLSVGLLLPLLLNLGMRIWLALGRIGFIFPPALFLGLGGIVVRLSLLRPGKPHSCA